MVLRSISCKDAYLYAILALLNFNIVTPFSTLRSRSFAYRYRLHSSKQAHALNTAFEWLAVERAMDHPYGNFSWFDPFNGCSRNGHSQAEVMPLYPLGATYLPTMMNHTLNNVEPRNVQMAMDLMKSEDPRFCAVLYAADTGRIASVGTIMRIVEIDHQQCQGSVQRVVVKCRAESLVDIVSIQNPDAASRENRLLRSPEYLKADVHPISKDVWDPVEYDALVSKILDDYLVVRFLYLDRDGSRDLPPFAMLHLADALPKWTRADFATELGFWKAAQLWQTLCYTVREGRQMTLSADRNELMVAAACKKGGPLKLPIHVEDLSPDVRKQLEEMEMQAQSEFMNLGLDPCLDFQVLLGMRSANDQLQFLSRMISRERKRLEAIPKGPLPCDVDCDDDPQRKGAWFEGFE